MFHCSRSLKLGRCRVRFFGLTAALLFGVCGAERIAAQGFGLSVVTATNTVALNSSVAFTITVTNLEPVDIDGVFVTNTFAGSAGVQFVSATTSQGQISTNSPRVIFNLGNLLSGGIAQMNVTLRPTVAGNFTNATFVRSVFATNLVTSNVVIQVSPVAGDLAVTVVGPTPPILVNDVITYRVDVTNAGTSTASTVRLTNSGLGSFKLLSLTPAGQSFTFTNGLLTLTVGNLVSRSNRTFTFSLQPTNPGTATLTATVGGASVQDTNTANNSATASFDVADYSAGELVATNASAMVFNPQTALMQQTVRLVNTGTNPVASSRVIVSGITNLLYNAAGTNAGNPYVVHGAPLAAGESADLLLEYFVPTRTPIDVPNSAYTAVALAAVSFETNSAPSPNITRVENLGTNGVLIEFAAVLNRRYTILYSADSTFTNAFIAQPSVVAPGDRVMWIDNGPPKTLSHPTTVGTRYYRVLLNP